MFEPTPFMPVPDSLVRGSSERRWIMTLPTSVFLESLGTAYVSERRGVVALAVNPERAAAPRTPLLRTVLWVSILIASLGSLSFLLR